MQEEKKRALSSWKEIAAYLGRDERTVRRWEIERRLPVHRGPGGRGRSVYAYATELDAWLAQDEATTPETPALDSATPYPSNSIPPDRIPAGKSLTRRIAVTGVALLLAIGGFFGVREFYRLQFSGPPRRVTLVVLPFANLSGDPQEDYFSDGLTEELISQLGGLSPAEMGVIARTSAMRYKSDNKKDVAQIARELNVDYLVEGSVRQSQDRGRRVTAQLIRASDQTHLWAESYDWKPGEILTMQRDLAQAMVRRIRLHIGPQEKERLARAYVPSLAAHEAYLRGRYFWNKRTPESLQKSVEQFEEALRLDPKYAAAHAGLADSYLVMSGYGLMSPQASYPKARAAAERALELDESLAAAHVALASELGDYERNWPAAEREFRRALQLNPGYATAHQWFSIDLSAQGRHEEAIAEGRLALELDPVSPIINATLGTTLYVAGRYDEAIQQLRKTVELEPNFAYGHSRLGFAYQARGMLPEALAEFQKALALSGDNPSFLAGLGTTYALMGKRRDAEDIVVRMKSLSSERYVSPFAVALVYTRLGKDADSFEWLQKAYRDRDDNLIFANVEPTFEALRTDQRFREILRGLNLADEGT